MEKEVKKEQNVSYMYKLTEMRDEITKSIENAENVVKQQRRLIAVLSKDKNDEKEFAQLINSIDDEIEKIKKNIVELKKRASLLSKVIDNKDNEMKVDDTVVLLLQALGLEHNEN